MIYQGNIMNLSNLIWLIGSDRNRLIRSMLLIASYDEESAYKHIYVKCGEKTIDDACAPSLYLAALTSGGGYTFENAERFIEEHADRAFLDVLHLPDEWNGRHFQKASAYPDGKITHPFNRWSYGLVSGNGCAIEQGHFKSRDCLQIDFADRMLVCDLACDRLPIYSLFYYDFGHKCTADERARVWTLARELLEIPHEIPMDTLCAWFQACDPSRKIDDRLAFALD